MKQLIRTLFARLGVGLYRLGAAGGVTRPIGEMSRFLQDLQARGFRPISVLDVGANRAEWSTECRHFFPSARYLLIEPQPEMKPFLTNFLRDTALAKLVEAGAGAQPGELIQTIWEDHNGSSFLPPPDRQLLATGRQRKVPIVTIDSLYADDALPLPELVKLDIQGFELEALRGATRLFGKTELFILEVSLFHFMPGQPQLADVVRFMEERGYHAYDFPGFMRRPRDGTLGQMDVAFAREGGALRASTAWD